ncbi:MAG: hypothetical protein IPG94_15230 [Kineosporiaceae bacterium]|nr:hypothetical protein [Kineosporiaceae bacterium]
MPTAVPLAAAISRTLVAHSCGQDNRQKVTCAPERVNGRRALGAVTGTSATTRRRPRTSIQTPPQRNDTFPAAST